MTGFVTHICDCSAYEFPHRVTSGQCTGVWWLRAYFKGNGDACYDCRYGDKTRCLLADSTNVDPAYNCPAMVMALQDYRTNLLKRRAHGTKKST